MTTDLVNFQKKARIKAINNGKDNNNNNNNNYTV